MQLTETYKRLCLSLLFHRYLYYVCGVSVISDREYDLREQKLREFEEEHPDLVRDDSPSKTVGSSCPGAYPECVQSYADYYYNKHFREAGNTGVVRGLEDECK